MTAVPSTPRERAFAARREATQRQIVDAAVALIADQGFTATSVDDIAELAGVAKGSVYYNFGSKSDLFEAVIIEGVTRLTAGLRQAGTGLTGRPALEALIAELLSQIRAQPQFAKLVVAEIFRTGRDWQDSIRLVREESMRVFADVIEQSQGSDGGSDPALVAGAVFGGTLVAGLEWLAFQPERTFEEVLTAVLLAVGGAIR